MKYAIILPDGAADEPLDELGGKTPLEAAYTPHMDAVSRMGRLGLVATTPTGFSPGSDICTMTLFGYDPRLYHTGRAPLEAAAQGLTLGENEAAFRCNLVTLTDGRMADFTAGHISSREARILMDELNTRLGDPRCRFHSGVSYRNLMIASPADELTARCTPPHDIPDQPVENFLPQGDGADWLLALMDNARAILAGHEINQVRRDLGENPATDIWLWGQGKSPVLPTFAQRFDINGACIAAVDLIRGLAKISGLKLIDVPGATGYLDTDYAAKGRFAIDALKSHDLVVVHVEAPDEAGHQGDARAKVQALERTDEHVVGPVLTEIKKHAAWRILIAPDHPTPCARRVHTPDPPPFCMAGTGIAAIGELPFSEMHARRTDVLLNPGHQLMEFFIRGGGV